VAKRGKAAAKQYLINEFTANALAAYCRYMELKYVLVPQNRSIIEAPKGNPAIIGTIQWTLARAVHPNQKRLMGSMIAPIIAGPRKALKMFLNAGFLWNHRKRMIKPTLPVIVPSPIPMNASPREPRENPYIGVNTRGKARKKKKSKPKRKAAYNEIKKTKSSVNNMPTC
jgi:hypothetical protein